MSEKTSDKAALVETQTIEVCEDDIYAYFYDENDDEIGFSVLNEAGEEVEYFYPEPLNSKSGKTGDNDIAQATSELNSIYHESHDVLVDLKDAVSDIQSSFKDIVKNS